MGDKHDHGHNHEHRGAPHDGKQPNASAAQPGPAELPRIDFSTFVLSLTGSAMVQLGRVPDPTGEHAEIDLGMARQTIDILTMLRIKTAGNLTPPESDLLERVLHDLRVAWIQEAQKHVA
ncbi:MAG: DUF1844 domain-containing protein [Deltaproteobacteria bacterium]|nr:DUF1844 domain-containing protein [Deltaproteobacteria bacterium]